MSRRRRVSRVTRRYAPKRYARRFRRGKAPLPLLPIIGGVVAPMADAVSRVGGIDAFTSNPIEAITGLIDQIGQKYTGFSPFAAKYGHESFNIGWAIPTYTGLFAGIAGHMIANKLGVNRYMKKIPLIGKYVQL